MRSRVAPQQRTSPPSSTTQAEGIREAMAMAAPPRSTGGTEVRSSSSPKGMGAPGIAGGVSAPQERTEPSSSKTTAPFPFLEKAAALPPISIGGIESIASSSPMQHSGATQKPLPQPSGIVPWANAALKVWAPQHRNDP